LKNLFASYFYTSDDGNGWGNIVIPSEESTKIEDDDCLETLETFIEMKEDCNKVIITIVYSN
jgi:hypothetical protein